MIVSTHGRFGYTRTLVSAFLSIAVTLLYVVIAAPSALLFQRAGADLLR
jgi:hypothetical protein